MVPQGAEILLSASAIVVWLEYFDEIVKIKYYDSKLKEKETSLSVDVSLVVS